MFRTAALASKLSFWKVPVFPIDVVARYGAARLEKRAGASVALRELHADYRAWCVEQGVPPASLVELTDCLQEIAEQVGDIEIKKLGRQAVLMHMQLRQRLAAA